MSHKYTHTCVHGRLRALPFPVGPSLPLSLSLRRSLRLLSLRAFFRSVALFLSLALPRSCLRFLCRRLSLAPLPPDLPLPPPPLSPSLRHLRRLAPPGSEAEPEPEAEAEAPKKKKAKKAVKEEADAEPEEAQVRGGRPAEKCAKSRAVGTAQGGCLPAPCRARFS